MHKETALCGRFLYNAAVEQTFRFREKEKAHAVQEMPHRTAGEQRVLSKVRRKADRDAAGQEPRQRAGQRLPTAKQVLDRRLHRRV